MVNVMKIKSMGHEKLKTESEDTVADVPIKTVDVQIKTVGSPIKNVESTSTTADKPASIKPEEPPLETVDCPIKHIEKTEITNEVSSETIQHGARLLSISK